MNTIGLYFLNYYERIAYLYDINVINKLYFVNSLNTNIE